MATLPQGLYGLRPPNPVTMALVGESPFGAADPVAALRAYAATLPPGVAAGPVKTAASGPDWGKIGDYLLTKSWPSRMVQAAWSAATLPGDVYAGRVDPNSDEGIARANDLAGLVTLGSGAVPGGGLRAGAKIAKGAPDKPAPRVETFYRGGWRPLDTEDVINRMDYVGNQYGAPVIFAHEDDAIAAMYGKSGPLNVDTSRFLDASTPDGMKKWKALNQDLGKAKQEGYAGVIYPDPHEWDVPTDGFEVAILDPEAILFSGGPGGIVPGAATMLQPGQAEAAPMQNGLFGLRP